MRHKGIPGYYDEQKKIPTNFNRLTQQCCLFYTFIGELQIMKPILYTFFAVIIALQSFAGQKTNKEVNKIVGEGKMLYRSEKASWCGTDIFLEKNPNTDNVGGYFSYLNRDTSICIFFSKGDSPIVLGTIMFDSTYKTANAKTSFEERPFTKMEEDLYLLRSKTYKEIASDSLFKRYNKTQLNVVPINWNGEKRVYVLTGTNENNFVAFGNDYLLTFDEKDNLLSKKKLHHNIIVVDDSDKENVKFAFHGHNDETGPFITATDICTIMLYEKIAKWKQYYVISSEYVSIWDCAKDDLFVMTTKAWKKIGKDQSKRSKQE